MTRVYKLPKTTLKSKFTIKTLTVLRRDDKAEELGLKGPGFNPQLRQEKLINIFSYFQLVSLEPMRTA